MEKRELKQTGKKGITLQDLLLTAVLLAAGAVLKFFVGTFINFFGMKPNFIIAMYCMAIVLIRPKIYYSLIIGIIAGAICQVFPGTPYLNFASEAKFRLGVPGKNWQIAPAIIPMIRL